MEWFKMQVIWGAAVERLSDAEAGRFIKALFAYVSRAEEYHGGGREEPTTCQALETLRADKMRLEAQRAAEEKRRQELSEKRRRAAEQRWGALREPAQAARSDGPFSRPAQPIWGSLPSAGAHGAALPDGAPGEGADGGRTPARADATGCNCMQTHANESICMQTDAKCTENKNKSKSQTVSPPGDHGEDDQDGAGARAWSLAAGGEEIAEALRRDEQIEARARAFGLPCHEGNMVLARDLARRYSLPWLLRAIETAGSGKAQTWDYVQGILRRYAQDGGPDAPRRTATPGRSAKTVSAQQYGQREYTESELEKVGGDLIAEARAQRGGCA